MNDQAVKQMEADNKRLTEEVRKLEQKVRTLEQTVESQAKWVVTDGNHRLAAAIYRGDKTIRVSPSGSCDLIDWFCGKEVQVTP